LASFLAVSRTFASEGRKKFHRAKCTPHVSDTYGKRAIVLPPGKRLPANDLPCRREIERAT
jgi:hypothetical protein